MYIILLYKYIKVYAKDLSMYCVERNVKGCFVQVHCLIS